MPTFTLKKYSRQNPNSSVGTLVAEWAIEASDNVSAIHRAQDQLIKAGFSLPNDFAILRDGSGKKIWDMVDQT